MWYKIILKNRCGWLLAKLCVLLLLVYVLKLQLNKQVFISNAHWFSDDLLQWRSILIIVGVLLLMPLNWAFEALKWQILVNNVYKVSFFNAYKAILWGVTVSLLTPNRVGEMGGRVSVLPSGYRIKGLAIAIVGSISQLIINITFGASGFLFFSYYFFGISSTAFWVYLAGIGFIVSFALFLYFNILKVAPWFKKNRYTQKIEKYFEPATQCSKQQLWASLGLSALRFSVYILQFSLLLYACNANGNSFFLVVLLILAIFFVQSVTPSVALIELGVRGNAAIWLGGYISNNNYGLLAATLLLWCINLVIPAFAGWVSWWKNK